MQTIQTQCCITGGGPAGMMLGLLLARAGIDVVVLEKHGDFLRDFRGDTIHPSTLELIAELGLLDRFLARPHEKVERLGIQIGDEFLQVADFARLPTRCKFIAMMPQWEFLDFLATAAGAYRSFELRMGAEATDLIEQDGGVVGVSVTAAAGTLRVMAGLVIGADGRHSTLRALAGLKVRDLGAPIDVLWMRLSRRPGDPEQSMGRIGPGQLLAMINRGSYWQCAYVIPKGGFDKVRQEGLGRLRTAIAALAPFLADRVEELGDWQALKLLTVAVDRLERWYRPGLLFIGDAAHAMSPIGGIGINLAIQDAVAAANILVPAWCDGGVGTDALAAVQRRRLWPTRLTQRLQVVAQERLIGRLLVSRRAVRVPRWLAVLLRLPGIRGLPARLVGMGVRPEHIGTGQSPPR